MRSYLKIALFGLVAVVGAGWASSSWAAPATPTPIPYFSTDQSACPGHCTLTVTTTGVPEEIIEREIRSLTCSMTALAGTVTGVVATVSIQTPPAADNPPPGSYLVYNLTGVAGMTVNGQTTFEIRPNGTAVPLVIPASSSVLVSFNLAGTSPVGEVVCALRGQDIPKPVAMF